MTFNFKKAIAQASNDLTNPALFAIILGQSGSGKSTVCGTLNEKSLYLYFSGESHGARNANAITKGEITPLCVDMDGEKQLGPDETYARLLEILSSSEIAKEGFKGIILDGFPELESIMVRTKKFRQDCLSDKGKHNSFAESRVVIGMYKPVLELLQAYHRKGIHILTTCKLDVRDMDEEGGISESAPRLMTYSVAEDLVSKFDDVLAIGKMTRVIEGVTHTKHKFQFLAGVRKVSKDMATGTVKKILNFSPRLSGVLGEKLPEITDADLQKIITIKKG